MIVYLVGISDCDVSNCCRGNLFGFGSVEKCSLMISIILHQTAFLILSNPNGFSQQHPSVHG